MGQEKRIILCAMPLLAILIFAVKHRDGHRQGDGAHEHCHGFRHKHGAWISIDYLAYSSEIKHWNPTFKVILSVLTIILCIVLNNVYISVVVILAMVYLVIVVGGLALHDYLSVLTIPLTFILVSILAIVVDFSSRPTGGYHLYLGFGYLYTTTAMLKNGVFQMLKIIAAISGLQLMILTTPSSEIISVIKQTHLPKDFIALMNMIYRYIFILLDVFAKMKNAAESRLGYRDLKTSWYIFGSVASNMKNRIVKVEDLHYVYGNGKPALDGVSIEIYEGEKIAVLGANGSGKSTFFLNLNGVYKPTHGKIIYREMPINKKNLNELRKNIGIVFQDADNQIIASTVLAEVGFGPMNLRLPREEVINSDHSQ